MTMTMTMTMTTMSTAKMTATMRRKNITQRKGREGRGKGAWVCGEGERNGNAASLKRKRTVKMCHPQCMQRHQHHKSHRLEVDGLVVGTHAGLLDSLRERGVGVARAGNVLRGGAVLHSKYELADELAGVGADDVSAEDLVGLGVGDNLDEAFSVVVGARAGVGHEGELADPVRDAVLLQVVLGAANGRDLGVGVDDARDGGVVDVAVLAGHDLDSSNALLLGLVGEHRAGNNVADGVDARHVALEVGVNLDLAALGGDAQSLEAETLGVGATAGGDEDAVSSELRLLVGVVDGGKVDGHHAVGALHGGLDALGEDKVELLLGENLLEGGGDFRVEAGGDAVVVLDDRNLAAEALVHGAELETNDTSTNNGELLGNPVEREGAGGCADGGLVDGDVGDLGGGGAGRDKDLVRVEHLGATGLKLNVDLVLAGQSALADDVVNLVLLEKTLNALGQATNGLLLGLLKLSNVHGDVLTALNTKGLEVLLGSDVVVSGVEQSLGGNAANVKAGATEGAAHFDAGNLHAELASLDGSDVATGATANNNEVILLPRCSSSGKHAGELRRGTKDALKHGSKGTVE